MIPYERKHDEIRLYVRDAYTYLNDMESALDAFCMRVEENAYFKDEESEDDFYHMKDLADNVKKLLKDFSGPLNRLTADLPEIWEE